MPDSKPIVYILHGDDEFAMSRFVDAMYARLGEPSTADLNFTRLDGRSTSDNELRNATDSMPFLADRRIVVLSHPLARQPDSAQKEARAHFQEKFLERLGHLPQSTALVLVFEDHTRHGDWELLNPSHWLIKWARQSGERSLVKDFPLPGAVEMQRWVVRQAETQGGLFSPQAAAALVEQVGNDTRVAALEITKLLTYVNFARPVETQDVARLTERIDQPDIFAMVDALGARNAHEALKRLHVLLAEQDWQLTFGMIVRQFRLLVLVREVLDQRGGAAQIVDQMRGEPFRIASTFMADKFVKQANQFTMAELEDVHHRLLDIDAAIKSSQIEPGVALDTFVAELAGGI